MAPHTIVELAERLDQVRSLSHVFIPDIGQGFTSLDICSACLAVSKRLRVGSGVVRILEYEPSVLARRMFTLQELSGSRFVLGIGTGPVGSDPGLTIRSMIDGLHSTRESFTKFAGGLARVRVPETFIATLRKGIAKTVAGECDGILLNFCPPEHVRDVVRSIGELRQGLIVSCYLKIFYARELATAYRMMMKEFAHYDQNPSYHKMFMSIGVAEEIARMKTALKTGENVSPSEKLLEISLASPSRTMLTAYVNKFREAGVDLPCLYPYFEPGEDEAYKMSKVMEIVQL
ncbi:MAG TPA: LLM class flavin-dependent oxidoreductase [Candidatus Bathyarchaeia archaeon]|nr:LLM class flavin-dependent oxidoreductase [Candidatus Bathyarchaeia archaeon]